MQGLFVDTNMLLTGAKALVPYAGAAVVGGGATIAALGRFTNWLHARHYDEWVVSSTTINKLPDGSLYLVLDNMDSPKTFDGEVRGKGNRKDMDAAAKRCTWDPPRRFLLGDDDKVKGMLHVTRNALSGYWKEGTRAKLEGEPVKTYTLFFSVTGTDAGDGAKKKYRVIVMNAHDMRLVLSHKGKWHFADETHDVRLETCKLMAQAWLRAGGHDKWEDCALKHPVFAGRLDLSTKKKIYTPAVVGWIRAYEPKLIAA